MFYARIIYRMKKIESGISLDELLSCLDYEEMETKLYKNSVVAKIIATKKIKKLNPSFFRLEIYNECIDHWMYKRTSHDKNWIEHYPSHWEITSSGRKILERMRHNFEPVHIGIAKHYGYFEEPSFQVPNFH